jgi:fatty acid desaturase
MNPGLRQLIDRSIISPIQRKSVRFLTKAALFAVAAFAFLLAILFAMAAFFIWLVQLAGAIVASIAVAGLFCILAIIAILFALYGFREKKLKVSPKQTADAKETARSTESPAQIALEDAQREESITEAVAPLLDVLRALGLKREELALLAGSELAKKLPPLTLVGLAIVCGFFIGRMNTFPFDLMTKKEST